MRDPWPNLRELTAELDGLRELLVARITAIEALATERDKWYTERDRDRQVQTDKALTATKEQTASSFAASKEAILKAEEAQKSYNATHNDLSRKLDEQNKQTMPRPEAQQRFDNLTKELGELKSAVMSGAAVTIGQRVVERHVKDDTRANVALGVSVLVLVMLIIEAVMRILPQLGGH